MLQLFITMECKKLGGGGTIHWSLLVSITCRTFLPLAIVLIMLGIVWCELVSLQYGVNWYHYTVCELVSLYSMV